MTLTTIAARCSWCGHPDHGETCPGTITAREGQVLCPCERGKR